MTDWWGVRNHSIEIRKQINFKSSSRSTNLLLAFCLQIIKDFRHKTSFSFLLNFRIKSIVKILYDTSVTFVYYSKLGSVTIFRRFINGKNVWAIQFYFLFFQKLFNENFPICTVFSSNQPKQILFWNFIFWSKFLTSKRLSEGKSMEEDFIHLCVPTQNQSFFHFF